MNYYSGRIRQFVLLFALGGFCNTSVFADNSQGSHTKSIDAKQENNASLSFNEWISDFEERSGQRIGLVLDGRVFFSGVGTIRVDPNHPSYGKELALAYERAMLDLQANFVTQNYGQQTVKRILEATQDASTNAEQFDPMELQRARTGQGIDALFNKAVLLIDKRLDNELRKEGVAQDKLVTMTFEQKKTLYRESLTKEIITSAFRNLQGLVPVQTRIFSQNTPNGKVYRVGVIAVQSQRTRQFAQDIANRRVSSVLGDAKRLEDILPSQEKELLNEIGLRLTFDEQRRPMLISYGRWSFAPTKDWSPARFMNANQIAGDQAKALAESAILEFINANIQVNDNRLVGNLAEEIIRKTTKVYEGDSKSSAQLREDIGETIDRISRQARTSAQGSLRGTTILKRWESTDDNGVYHVGTVVAWTNSQLENANEIDSGRARNQVSPGSLRSENRNSRIINNPRDF